MNVKGPLLIVVDQGVNSISNFAIVAIAARSTSVRQFGIFALSQACVLLLLSCIQAGSADSFLRESDGTKRSRLQDQGVGSIVAVFGAGALISTAATLSGVPAVNALAGSAVCCSLIAGIDFARNNLIADGRVLSALLMDLLYAASQLTLFILLVWHHASDVRAIWWVWSVSAVPALLAFWPARLLRLRRWRLSASSFRFRYALETFLASGSSQIAQFLVTPVLGIAFSARFRAGTLLMGPLTVFLTGGRVLVLTLYKTRVGIARYRMMVRLCVVSCVVTVAWGVCVLLMPVSGVRLALGANGIDGRQLVPPLIAAFLAQAVFLCIYYYARSVEADHATTQGRVATAAVLVVVVISTQFSRSASWFVLGTAASVVLACVVMVVALRRGHGGELTSEDDAIGPENASSQSRGRHRRSP